MKNPLKFFVLFIVSFVLSSRSTATDRCSVLLARAEFGRFVEYGGSLPKQVYIQNRHFGAYGFLFRNFVEEMPSFRGVWLDVGAGNGYAIETFLKTANPEARAIGVVVEPPPLLAPTLLSFVEQNRLNWFQGKKIEEIPDEDLGAVNYITDALAAMVYSETPDIILRKYLRLTAPGGVIQFAYQYNSRVLVGGNEIPLAEWLEKRIDWRGAVVTRKGGGNYGGTNVAPSFRIETNSESWKIQIPKLRFLKKTGGYPPPMTFEQID